MSKPKSFKESLVIWRTMADNVAKHLEELPQLRDLQDALAAHVDRSLALQRESELYESRLREVNHEKAVAFVEGRELRNRLALGLQAVVGAYSEKLIEFGVTPRPRFARRHRLTNAEKAERAAAAGGAARKNDPAIVN